VSQRGVESHVARSVPASQAVARGTFDCVVTHVKHLLRSRNGSLASPRRPHVFLRDACTARPILLSTYTCPERFSAAVSQYHNNDAYAVEPIVAPLHAVVPDLRVAVWKVTHDRVDEFRAITLHGSLRGRLVGVVYYL
jgi:hypothetical protein